MIAAHYGILGDVRLANGLYKASPSKVYSYIWIRDAVYMSLPFMNKSCNTFERTYHRLFDMLREYEWKLDYHTKHKPTQKHEYIHARYSAEDVKEIDEEWGHAQHDAIGAMLWAIGEGQRAGKKVIRDDKDLEIVQKLVYYLQCCNYWIDADNGMWEEWTELHASSVGACIAGLQSVRDIVDVPSELIRKGYYSLASLFPLESADRPVDLAQMSLIYPYNVLQGADAELVVKRIEETLLRSRGVIRYEGDSYYSTKEMYYGRNRPLDHYFGTEAEWTFGLPWLALCHNTLGNTEKAKEYLKRTEEVMLPGGALPELYFSNSSEYNGNTPLGWCSAMYILAYEAIN